MLPPNKVIEILQKILKKLDTIENEQEQQLYLALLALSLFNGFGIPMRGTVMQLTPEKLQQIKAEITGSTEDAAAVLDQLFDARAYYVYPFPQISSSGAAVVFYKNRQNGELYLVVTQQ